jgi:apolipoprotein N-acyltransferase
MKTKLIVKDFVSYRGLMNSSLLKIILCIVSGVLLIFSAEPVNIPWFCFIAYVPFLFVIESEKSFWKLFLYSWLCMFVQIIIGFQWVHYVAMEFGLLSWWPSFFILIVFALFTNLSLQLFAVLYWLSLKFVKNNKTFYFYILIIPALFVLSEIIDPKIFNWYLGNLVADYKYMFQFASVFGVSGLSFFIILINVLVYLLIRTFIKMNTSISVNNGVNIKKNAKKIDADKGNNLELAFGLKKFRVFLFIFIIAIFLFLNIYGYYEFKSLENIEDKCPKINIGVIQANIGNPAQLKIQEAIKLKKEFGIEKHKTDASLILKKYQSMTEALLKENKDIDLIVWPETAFPTYYIENNLLAKNNTEFQKKMGVPFLIGGYYLNDLNGNYYNSAIYVNKNKLDFYHKKILLPFGEYMPLRDVFPLLKRIVPSVGDFSRGDGAATLDVLIDGFEIRFAPTICYEILKANYVRQMVYKDAHVFLNLSNDSWFGTIEPYQHLKIARAKAVEFRRPIIRSTNTGISSFVDMKGSVVKSGGLNNEDALVFTVPICDHRIRSLYSGFTYLFPYFLFIITVISLYQIRKRKTGKK